LKKIIITTFIFLILIITIFLPCIISGELKNNIANINLSEKEQYDMIIIAPSYFSTALESLITHKNDNGILTKLVTLDEIYEEYYFPIQGRDDQEKIKYFIKNSIETWQNLYVLFVGDYKTIPVRYCFNNDTYSFSEPSFISELYYADIYETDGNFSTWDTDNDGFFGEWDGMSAEDNNIDLFPDVCIGRLACKDIRDVNIIVRKIINYEKNPADPSWFKRFGVVGGDTYPEIPGYEGEEYNQMAIDIMNDFTPVKLWVSNGYLTEKGWHILKLINQGCGFLYLSGHGSPKTWITKNSEGEWIGEFNQLMMYFLINQNRLPICLVGGCHNSQFDTNIGNLIKNPIDAIYHSTWLPKCWSWQLMSRPFGGAIATIGTTGLCWYSCEFNAGGIDWLNLQFFREYQNDEYRIGKIWAQAIVEYLYAFPIEWNTPAGGDSSLRAKTLQEWTLLGDPSLTIGGEIK
jgi:hypothetical protein